MKLINELTILFTTHPTMTAIVIRMFSQWIGTLIYQFLKSLLQQRQKTQTMKVLIIKYHYDKNMASSYTRKKGSQVIIEG